MSSKRIVSLTLILSLLLANPLLTGCSGNSSDGGEKQPAEAEEAQSAAETVEEAVTAEPEEETYNIFDVLPEADYGGRDFNFFIPHNFECMVDVGLYAPELTGVTFDDAVYNRNLLVSNEYNVNVMVSRVGLWDACYDNLKPAIMAGDHEYNIFFTHVNNRNGTMAIEGLCMDWKDIPLIQWDMPWWNQYANENLSIAGRSLFAVSSINFKDICTIVFNKEMADSYVDMVGNLYDTVRSGEWTMDRMLTYAEAITMDKNGDGTLKPDDDVFGLTFPSGWQTASLTYAADMISIKLDENGYPVSNLGDERMYTVYDKIAAIVHSPNVCTSYTSAFPNVGMETNRVMFAEYNLLICDTLRETEVDYGILPLPKLDEAQDKYITNTWTGMMLVPSITPESDLEMIGTIMEAMSYLGYSEIIPLYYDNVLKNKVSRDKDSVEMLDIINANVVYDVGMNIYTNLDAGYFVSNNAINNTPYASAVKSIEKPLMKSYENIYKKIVELP